MGRVDLARRIDFGVGQPNSSSRFAASDVYAADGRDGDRSDHHFFI